MEMEMIITIIMLSKNKHLIAMIVEMGMGMRIELDKQIIQVILMNRYIVNMLEVTIDFCFHSHLFNIT